MTFTGLALHSLRHYRRTNAAVMFGVAGAVAVLAGSLIVGASVRESLRSIAASRLGATSVVIAAPQPFTEALADRLKAAIIPPVAPMFGLNGLVVHTASSRRAGNVSVYGVDARFFLFHGVQVQAPEAPDVLLSPDLAAELGAAAGDAVVVRIAKPTDIPIDSLHGRRDEVGRAIRLTVRGTLGRDELGEFSLSPGQGPVRAVFLRLSRLQRDLSLEGRINTVLVGEGVSAAGVRQALASNVSLDDFGLTVEALPESTTVAIESKSGLLPDPVVQTLEAIARRQRLDATEVLTWLATGMTVGTRTVPYSIVTALGPSAAGDRNVAAMLDTDGSPPPMVLNAWAARDLGAAVGSTLDLSYLRWADEGRLVEERASFRVVGIVPMHGIATDRRWAPDYPGITTASDLSDWDPPFPIDLSRVRPQDEDYWDEYRTSPKAFIPLATGQSLWKSRHGQVTSIRLRPASSGAAALEAVSAAAIDDLDQAIARGLNPARAGLNVADTRAQNLSASAGATDFGAYFSYFSFFLMVSALLLSALFFRLNIEQRLPQIGVLRAGGFSLRDVRRALLVEGLLVAIAGAVLGSMLAVAWAAAMMAALRTWWIGAVGTTLLRLHVDAVSLGAGALGATVAAALTIAWTVRMLSRSTPRAQLAGATDDGGTALTSTRRWIAPAALGAALLLSALSMTGLMAAAGGFFGAGALVLIGGLAAFRSWLGRSGGRSKQHPGNIRALGLRNAAWRPGRSLTVVGLVAAAVFLLVSVDSFRKTVGATGTRDSGTGGFALMAESAIPIVHDIDTAEGRDAVGLMTGSGAGSLAGVRIFSLRLRPGDDASCLNLYQPKQPRVVGVSDAFIEAAPFRFASSLAADDTSRQNPWTLLNALAPDGAIPAIADQTSLEYVLHVGVGDVLTIDEATSRPVRLRIVAALADSVLQGELLVGDAAFRRAFPDVAGYRVFMIELDSGSPERLDAVTTHLEEDLDPFGFDVEQTARRLEAFHRVENTYLSTFQALGGLGLLLGCLGLVAVVLRNVLERRRELALLGAAGFTGRDLQRLVAIEHIGLVGVGLAVGVVAAALAVTPVMIDRGGDAPWLALVWLVPVAVAGMLAAWGATRSLRRLPLVASLRSE